MSLLEFDRVDFGYARERPVLDGVSFELRQGVNLGLVGESGSGKSTILRLLLGLNRPGSGVIRFADARLDPGDRRFMHRYRRAVQAVFQDPYSSLNPRLTVASIVAEPFRSLGVSGSEREAVTQALAEVGLGEDALGRYPHAFSGGQRQRIAIARAIVARPQVLLADEAVSALDLSTRTRIIDLLKRLSGEVTILFVSHDLAAVAALCDDLVILERGRVVEAGKTGDILTSSRNAYTRKLLASVPRLDDVTGAGG